MANITYLFGAGASVGALPMVTQMAERIGSFINLIGSSQFALNNLPIVKDREETKAQILAIFINDLRWLQKACYEHASIDTFAKKLYIRQDNIDLRRLKATLSAYLILEQVYNYKVEKRYDAFFASILDNDVSSFPSNIKILSWNYDYQFEQAYSGFSDYTTISQNQSALKVVSKFQTRFQLDNSFAIYKINGTTGVYRHSHHQLYHTDNKIPTEFNLAVIEATLSDYYHIKYISDDVESTLSFAWENENQAKIIDPIKEATGNTDVLVVIGYSFPFFNRTIDRDIIKNMHGLNKVYFQAPDADNIKERFLSILPTMENDRLVSRFNVDQFFLPDEL